MASLNERTDTLAQNTTQELYESGHHFMSKKHTLPRQPESRTFPAENSSLEERLEVGAVTVPDVDAVGGTNRVEIYALRQTQASEERISEVLV